MGLLDIPFVRRTRRNHAIEHATIHILTARHPELSLAGRADHGGFYVFGEVDPDTLRAAADEAIERLPREPELAIHPHCGTNLVVSGLLGGLASLAAISTLSRSRRGLRALDVLPRLIFAGTLASVASQSLGPAAQRRLTTHPDAAGSRVTDVARRRRGRHVVSRVTIVERAA